MPLSKKSAEAIERHPCFSEKAHFCQGRIHLPVAPRCNIQCAYCDRKYDCPNESRPGVTSVILTPEQAAERVRKALDGGLPIRVAGIAGPGEPLYNEETFATLRLVGKRFPKLIRCLSTNGLLLPEKLPELLDCGVHTLTVTVNTRSLKTAERLYIHTDTERLLQAQERGIILAVQAGLAVKMNTVLVPGINEEEIETLAKTAAAWGVVRMNLLPLIPQAWLRNTKKPDCNLLEQSRCAAGRYLEQFTLCRQCRADACGVPGKYDVSQSLFPTERNTL